MENPVRASVSAGPGHCMIERRLFRRKELRSKVQPSKTKMELLSLLLLMLQIK